MEICKKVLLLSVEATAGCGYSTPLHMHITEASSVVLYMCRSVPLVAESLESDSNGYVSAVCLYCIQFTSLVFANT